MGDAKTTQKMLLLLAGAVVFAACDSGSGRSSPTTEPAASDDTPATFRFGRLPVEQVAAVGEAHSIDFDADGALYICGEGGVYKLELNQSYTQFVLDTAYGVNGRAGLTVQTSSALIACRGFRVFENGFAMVRDVGQWWLVSEDGGTAADAGVGTATAVATRGLNGSYIESVFSAGSWTNTRRNVVLEQGALQHTTSQSTAPQFMTAALRADGGLVGASTEQGAWYIRALDPSGSETFGFSRFIGADGAEAEFCSASSIVEDGTRVLVHDSNCAAVHSFDSTSGAFRSTTTLLSSQTITSIGQHPNGRVYQLWDNELVAIE